METMTLVEQHVIKRSDSRFWAIDEAAFKAKNLYNAANYELRQSFCRGHGFIPFATLSHRMKSRRHSRGHLTHQAHWQSIQPESHSRSPG